MRFRAGTTAAVPQRSAVGQRVFRSCTRVCHPNLFLVLAGPPPTAVLLRHLSSLCPRSAWSSIPERYPPFLEEVHPYDSVVPSDSISSLSTSNTSYAAVPPTPAGGGPHARLASSTRGVVFYATPHFGNGIAALGWKLRYLPGALPAPSLARLTPGELLHRTRLGRCAVEVVWVRLRGEQRRRCASRQVNWQAAGALCDWCGSGLGHLPSGHVPGELPDGILLLGPWSLILCRALA